jgi:hypothetical protein
MLDQGISLTKKTLPENTIDLAYAFSLANSVKLILTAHNGKEINAMGNMIALKNQFSEKMTSVDLILNSNLPSNQQTLFKNIKPG